MKEISTSRTWELLQGKCLICFSMSEPQKMSLSSCWLGETAWPSSWRRLFKFVHKGVRREIKFLCRLKLSIKCRSIKGSPWTQQEVNKSRAGGVHKYSLPLGYQRQAETDGIWDRSLAMSSGMVSVVQLETSVSFKRVSGLHKDLAVPSLCSYLYYTE